MPWRGVHGELEHAVLFLDLDDFKTVNDSLGHGAGDDVLVDVARRLLACSAPADTVARLGGDEFAVLIEDIAEPGRVVEQAERLLAAVGEPDRHRRRDHHRRRERGDPVQ